MRDGPDRAPKFDLEWLTSRRRSCAWKSRTSCSIDIVGYSRLSIDEQRAAIERLNSVVQSTEEFRKDEAARRLVKIPTGDGMALVFFDSPEAPVECALEISRRLASANLPLRIGIHSGPVSGLVDVNGRGNVAGEGINMAQRVMDCADAGHILLSKRVADDLAQFKHWRPHLHESAREITPSIIERREAHAV
jgi:class 3 adenylate cyclase